MADNPFGDLLPGAAAPQPLQPIVIGRPNPLKTAKDQADLNNTNSIIADRNRQAERDAERLRLDREKFAAEQAKALRDAENKAAPLTAKERADAIAGYKSATSLDRIVKQLDEQYTAGPGSTTGIRSLRDYLPLTANKQFDSSANAARGIVGSALGFTGGQLNTATEAEMAVGPYLPKSSDPDDVIRDKIQRLREIADDARVRSTAILGGIPDANGRVTPLPDDRRDPAAPVAAGGGAGGNGGGPGSVFNQTFIQGGGGGPGAAGQGATSQQIALPPQVQQELQSYIQQQGANLDPGQLRSFIDGLYTKYGFAPNAGNAEWAQGAAQAAKQGGTINTNVPGPTVPLSGVDKAWNDVAASPTATAFANSADAVGWGALSLAQGDKLRAASDLNPLSAVAGQVVGSVYGTKGVGMFGRGLAKKVAPPLLGGGARSQLLRDLGTDAVYSGIYGANQGQDPALSAAVGVGGSLFGRGVGKAISGTVGGATPAVMAQYLKGRGISTTVGQSLGGLAKKAEDAMTSIPGVGDLIGARRLEGLKDFNRAVLNEAGEPINATVSNVGESGLNELSDQIGDAYRNATAGVNVPLDPQFNADLSNIARARNSLPADYATKFDKVGENRIAPILDNGALTGDLYQQSMRGLKGSRASASGAAPGFEQEYRDLLTGTMGAIKGQMQRGGGQRVVDDLAAADRANRLMKTAQAAASSAKNGTGSGEIQVFTPAQLNSAAYATERKYPGPRPFAELADAGQQVLPSTIPDSGTGRRLAQMAALPGGLAAGGGAYGAATGGDDRLGGASSGALTGLALATALGLGGTKVGQKALDNVLFVRPDAARIAGKKLTKARRMFGAGFIPLALPLAADQ